MPLYLIDANFIIDAKDTYYEIERVPQFWEWLIHHGNSGHLKMPLEIFEEVSPGRDRQHPFYQWRTNTLTKEALILQEDPEPDIVQRVLDDGYGRDLTENELINIGKDAFLIAAAIAAPDRVVVTSEVTKRTARRGKARIPDVCDDLGVQWIDEFRFIRALDFKTNWEP